MNDPRWTVVHCWEDSREDDPDAAPATCLLLDGHAGPHVWTPDAEIVVRLEKELGS